MATAGIPAACGIAVARDELAATGVPKNYDIALHVLDDQSKPTMAAQQASKLTSDGIKLFVGGTSTGTVLAMLPILKDGGVLFTGGTSKGDQLFDAGVMAVRLNSNAGQDAAAIAQYVTGELAAKKVAFVALQGAYADSVLASLKAAFGTAAQISKSYIVPADATNFQSTITSLSADKPDAVLLAMFGTPQITAFMRQYKQASVGVPLVVTPGLLFPGVAKAAGGAAEGIVSAELWTNGLSNAANTAMRAAFDKYASKHSECSGLPIDKQFAVSYGELQIVAQAIDKTQSTDPAVLYKALMSGTWDVPQGRVQFDEKGQAKVGYTLIVGKGETVVPLR